MRRVRVTVDGRRGWTPGQAEHSARANRAIQRADRADELSIIERYRLIESKGVRVAKGKGFPNQGKPLPHILSEKSVQMADFACIQSLTIIIRHAPSDPKNSSEKQKIRVLFCMR